MNKNLEPMEEIGVIGLGVMGKNIVLNLVDHSFRVHVFNRSYFKTQEMEFYSKRICGYEKLEEMVRSMRSPRRILLMVPSGGVTDEFLEELGGMLEKMDVVVDCGNSHFKDTIRRSKEERFRFVGCGISGGEEGARHGPSVMIGCKRDVYDEIGSVFEKIGAKYNGKPCSGWLGEDGAGHFVKTVHNGIEYCEMQILQEILNIMRRQRGEEGIERMKEMLGKWKNGRLDGYLVEICAKILGKRDEKGYMVEMIEDKAGQKGTGKICVECGVEMEVETSAMMSAVAARFLSQKKERRSEFARHVGEREVVGEVSEEDIEKAFYLSKAVSYIQGAYLLKEGKEKYGWEYGIGQICEIWRNGCILRCEFLDVVKEMGKWSVMETSEEFLGIYRECVGGLKRVCRFMVENEIYGPVISGSLGYVSGLQMGKGNGSLIQALRDCFGRHGVVLVGETESRNVVWE